MRDDEGRRHYRPDCGPILALGDMSGYSSDMRLNPEYEFETRMPGCTGNCPFHTNEVTRKFHLEGWIDHTVGARLKHPQTPSR
jgi:hypothetical protein